MSNFLFENFEIQFHANWDTNGMNIKESNNNSINNCKFTLSNNFNVLNNKINYIKWNSYQLLIIRINGLNEMYWELN